ncbi:immunoglobulin kappa light chain-like [Tachysurus vachellii]|uniref:immunoglobulin kappa light chain-like n=1 Tax=Tachysurus vachellii TaxID=175792 RepID=UPI00296B0C5F|nr:immunoglobulin kappa light chain-like [Tachysurus vachellii]
MKCKMSAFGILVLIFSTMYAVHPGRHWVTAQFLTDPPVYQPDKEISVNIGDSATVRCCFSEKEFGMMALFKQPDRKKPQTIVKFFKTSEEMFYNGLQKSRFQIEQTSNCFNMTILNIMQSDEAMYYCALLMTHNPVFGDGTYLKIRVKTSSEDSSGTKQIQESEAKTVIYTDVQFNKMKAKAEKRKPDLAEDCVYSSVK